jgi:GGDEF domain-containing protein
MAASYDNPRREVHSTRTVGSLAGLELSDRLAEEIARAERHSTRLSCLLLVVENLDAMAREHGFGLREQMLTYITSALTPALRVFDRIGRPAEGDGDLLILLPGADGPQAEIVARRVLERLRTVKLESGGQRAPLRLSVGLAAWREPSTAEDLFDLAHAAAVRPNGNGNGGGS